MIDFAMNRPAVRCATDFGKTARMDSPTVKRFLPWIVATALFMEQLDSTTVNTAVPSMAASLHVTPLSLKAVVASYILSLAVCIPVSGWIADRFGTRRVFALAIAVFTISSVFCGLAMNVPQMVAARISQGIGAAMMMPVGRLTVIRTFPKAELLRAMNFVIIPVVVAGDFLRECSGRHRRAVAHSSLYAGLLWRRLAPARCDRGCACLSR